MIDHNAEWFTARLPGPELLERILGDDPVSALLQATRDRAPVETGFRLPADMQIDPTLAREFEIATVAAKKLKESRRPNLSGEEVRALHAFVHILARPALRVFEGDLPRIPESWRLLRRERDIVKRRIRGVGRIDDHERNAKGTGWFVAPDLLITNNHVVAQLCGIDVHRDRNWRAKLDQRLPGKNEQWQQSPKLRPVWDAGDSPGVTEAAGRIRHVRFTHAKVDLALLEVDGVANSDALVVPLSSRAPAATDAETYLAGYPAVKASERALHPALVKLLFDGSDPIVHKRVSPGRMTDFASPKMDHDASTLGGSSGSPVIDFDSHRAVGLHFSGSYGKRNVAVALWSMQSDPVFSENGIEFW